MGFQIREKNYKSGKIDYITNRGRDCKSVQRTFNQAGPLNYN